MRLARLAPFMVLFAVTGCGGGSGRGSSQLPGPANSPGQRVITDNNCLACHRLGGEGNPSPGKDLTHIGSKLTAAKVRQALVAPPQGMPAYSQLPARDREAVVTYLSGLR